MSLNLKALHYVTGDRVWYSFSSTSQWEFSILTDSGCSGFSETCCCNDL